MGVSLLNKLVDTPLVFIDVETTGASAQWGDRVIEMGAVRIENGRAVGSIDQLIDPGRRISPGVVALTGITNEMVAGQSRFEAVLPHVVELMRDAVVVGHNVRFDLSFLRCEFRQAKIETSEMLGRAHVVDTLRLARRRFGRGGNGLQNLSRRLGVTPTVAHRALADVETTLGVFGALIEPAGGWQMDLCNLIQLQGGPMRLMPAAARESPLPLGLAKALEHPGLFDQVR